MTDLAKLRDDHAELIRLVRRLAELIDQPAAPAQLELFELRRALSSTLIAHLKAEDWVLYPRLLASGDAAIAAVAAAFNEEMGGLANAYVAHTDMWSATAIAEDWALLHRDPRHHRRADQPHHPRKPRAIPTARSARPRRLSAVKRTGRAARTTDTKPKVARWGCR